jgi:RHS repeat-associated protein
MVWLQRQQYDGLDRLTRLTHAKGANTLADFQYQFNTVNNITQMTDAFGANNYTYDSLDRLTAATHPSQTNESYTFDDVGNRTASHQGSSYTYQAFNRLVAANGASFGYDANGNLISKTDASGSWTYSWDYENRLKEASLSGGVTVGYNYDALGRRVQLTSTTGGITKFVYDGPDVLRDLDGNGSMLADYLNGPGIDNKLRQTINGISSYFVPDHLGTTRALVDANGNLTASLQYDSFGNVTSGSALTVYTYTGREIDLDTDLMYYRARWYDPREGRFIADDPIGLAGGLNQYVYVENQPTAEVDPLGLQGLLPLGRNGRSRRDISRPELERIMTPRGRGLPAVVKEHLDRGCIGLCSAYQGYNEPFPENAPRTACYLAESRARSRRCPRCCRNIVFAKQGQWLHGQPTPEPRTGQIPNNAISSAGGDYNYAIYFPSTRSYAWMDHTIRFGPQTASIASFVPNDPHYPHTIWCSTCKQTH